MIAVLSTSEQNGSAYFLFLYLCMVGGWCQYRHSMVQVIQKLLPALTWCFSGSFKYHYPIYWQFILGGNTRAYSGLYSFRKPRWVYSLYGFLKKVNGKQQRSEKSNPGVSDSFADAVVKTEKKIIVLTSRHQSVHQLYFYT